ncbi:MAG: hypothetical protein IKH57_08595 [Clostridia bacterium]|nr:hypothetical protein [Clostridia bacterium]
MVDEIADITFAHAMQLIVDILLQSVQEHFALSNDQLNAFVQQFYDRLPAASAFSRITCLLILFPLPAIKIPFGLLGYFGMGSLSNL